MKLAVDTLCAAAPVPFHELGGPAYFIARGKVYAVDRDQNFYRMEVDGPAAIDDFSPGPEELVQPVTLGVVAP